MIILGDEFLIMNALSSKLLVTNASDFALESKLPDENELLADIYL